MSASASASAPPAGVYRAFKKYDAADNQFIPVSGGHHDDRHWGLLPSWPPGCQADGPTIIMICDHHLLQVDKLGPVLKELRVPRADDAAYVATLGKAME